MLTKFASFESAEVLDIKGTSTRQHSASLDKVGDYENYRTGDGYLYVRIRAISSRTNRNHDGWPSIELAGSKEIFDRHHSAGGFTVEAAQGNPEYGFATFIGKPIFVDHHNSNPKKARGVIVDAKFNVLDHKTATKHDSYWGSHDVDHEHLPPSEVELLLEVDAKSFPRLAKAILDGDLDGFSMGADVDYSKCSHCGHIATAPDEYCSHVMMKGAHHDFKTAEGKRVSKKSYENCYGVKFFEISAVFDPADETALAREVRAAVHKEAGVDARDPMQNYHSQVADLAMAYQMKGVDSATARDMAERKVKKDMGLGGNEGYRAPHEMGDMPQHGQLPNWRMDPWPQEATIPTEPLNDPRWSKTAENDLPQEMHTRAPDELDTLRDEQLCPICGNDMEGETCSVCFAPGTLVRTKKGYQAIETIKLGDFVLGAEGQFRRVASISERDFDGTLKRIDSPALVQPILTTDNHPFSVLVGHNHLSTKKEPCKPSRCDRWSTEAFTNSHHLRWVHAGCLNDQSYVAANVPVESFDRQYIDVPAEFLINRYDQQWRRGPSRFELTNDLLWAIGLYLAEGSRGSRYITYSLHRNETIYQERLLRIFSDYGYNTRLETRDTKPNSAWVHIHSSVLTDWWSDWLGNGCDQKHIPQELCNLPISRLVHLYQGYLDGDGCIRGNSAKTTSSILALQITEIAQRIGVKASIQREYPSNKRAAYTINNVLSGGRDYYKPTTTRRNHNRRNTWEWDGHSLYRLTQVDEVAYNGKVYNLTVEGHPTYTVQNLLVHNCGYVEPPKEFDNPDLGKAQEIREKMKAEEEAQSTQPQTAQQPGGTPQQGGPNESTPASPMSPTKAPSTAKVKSDMFNWTPKLHPKTAARINQTERPIGAPRPASNEPQNATVTKDQTVPVTSAMRTAQDLINRANQRTAEGPTPPNASETDAHKRVNVTDVGGVDVASNEEASKSNSESGKPALHKQVDVMGIGGVMEGVEADRTESLPTAGRDGDDSGFNTEKTTDDSGPTKTFGDKDGQHPGVTDPVTSETPYWVDESKWSARQAYENGPFEKLDQQDPSDPLVGGGAKSGTDPADPIGRKDTDRIDVMDYATSPDNNSGPTKTWSGTDGTGVTKQQPPVINEDQEWGGIKVPDVTLHTNAPSNSTVSSRISLSALRLAEAEIELGLTPREDKFNRIMALDSEDPHVVQAKLEALSQVKTAGLAKLTQHRQAGLARMPRAFGRNTAAPDGFQRVATGAEQIVKTPIDDATFDAGLFLR